jgi:hypothetical protein
MVRHDADLDILVPFLKRPVTQLDHDGEIKLEEDARVKDVIESLVPRVVYTVPPPTELSVVAALSCKIHDAQNTLTPYSTAGVYSNSICRWPMAPA